MCLKEINPEIITFYFLSKKHCDLICLSLDLYDLIVTDPEKHVYINYLYDYAC